MNDRRIITTRDCGDDCDESCRGNCGAIPIIGATNDDDMLFKPGAMVMSKLTGEKLMVLKTEPDCPVTYIVRTKEYQMVQMFEFEIVGLEE